MIKGVKNKFLKRSSNAFFFWLHQQSHIEWLNQNTVRKSNPGYPTTKRAHNWYQTQTPMKKWSPFQQYIVAYP